MRTLALHIGVCVVLCASSSAARQAPRGQTATAVDVASVEMGGRIESASSPTVEPDWVAHNLITRTPFHGWSPASPDLPQEIVFSFFGRQAALVSSVEINPRAESVEGGAKDIEIWVSAVSATEGFTKIAEASLSQDDRLHAITFDPIETRFVKLRIVSAYSRIVNDEAAETPPVARQVRILEARRPGYIPILDRNLDLATTVRGKIPTPPPGDRSAIPPGGPTACAMPATEPPAKPAFAESRRVLVLSDSSTFYAPMLFKTDREIGGNDYSLFGRLELTWITPHVARPALLLPAAGFDTVAMSQICAVDEVVSKDFKQALMAWVAAGHKLIIHDSDGCSVPDRTDPNRTPDYSFLPYRLETNNPGKAGVDGDGRLLENSTLASARREDAAFIDMPAWLKGEEGNYNELGDSNVIVVDDPRWCGSIVGTNALKRTGFIHAYARYGRGLIIYNGLDLEHIGVPAYERLLTRELAQPFDPDGLPCSHPAARFQIMTDGNLQSQLLSTGKTFEYPIAIVATGAVSGMVTLDAAVQPADPAISATLTTRTADLREAPAAATSLAVVVGAAASLDSKVVAVRGRDAAGKSSVLCLHLTGTGAGAPRRSDGAR